MPETLGYFCCWSFFFPGGRLWCKSHRVAAFDVTDHRTSATSSVPFTLKTTWQENSKFTVILENENSLELTTCCCNNCHCCTGTMGIKLSAYETRSASETVASIQLLLNSVFFCLAEVSHVILWHQCCWKSPHRQCKRHWTPPIPVAPGPLVAGASLSPKGITRNLYKPKVVANAVSSQGSSDIGTADASSTDQE